MDCKPVSVLTRRAGDAWRHVGAGEALLITRRGAPVGLVVSLLMDEAEVLRAYRAARMAAAIGRLQASARAGGADGLTDEEIQAEIDAVRRERTVRAAMRDGRA